MKIYKAYAKVNIFLKITGMRGDYHEILSRFMLVKSLHDELSFVPKDSQKFEIIGSFDCKVEQNTIYKAYKVLQEHLHSEALEKLVRNYAVQVNKNIPSYAGLGGGSSDAATFMKMCNEVLHLGLSLNELATLGAKVGADVPFFIYGYESANVSGIGEVVKKFDEPIFDIETYTPDVKISTPAVYKSYRENFYDPIDGFTIQKLEKSKSVDILKEMDTAAANDLFQPAMHKYKELKKHYRHGWHFSGSGSSFFRIKEKMNG